MKKALSVMVALCVILALLPAFSASAAVTKYDAREQFGNTQGQFGWYYFYGKSPSSYTQCEEFDTTRSAWITKSTLGSWLEVKDAAISPRGANDVDAGQGAYGWKAPADGTAVVSGSCKKIPGSNTVNTDNWCDGATVKIYHNIAEKYSQFLPHVLKGQTGELKDFGQITIQVKAGDFIYFAVDAGANNGDDWTEMVAKVDFDDGQGGGAATTSTQNTSSVTNPSSNADTGSTDESSGESTDASSDDSSNESAVSGTSSKTSSEGETEKGGVNVIVIVIIGAVVLAGAGVGGFFIYKNKFAAK